MRVPFLFHVVFRDCKCLAKRMAQEAPSFIVSVARVVGLHCSRGRVQTRVGVVWCCFFRKTCNDPSAGSPTETLLRLHLPLNDEI